MKRIPVILLGALLLYVAGCGDDNPCDNIYDYEAYTFIDTVLVADTIRNNALAQVVYALPGGCNGLERIESRERGDTLELMALLHHHRGGGVPCVHPPGLASAAYSLQFSATGVRYLSYCRSEGREVVQSVYVQE